MATVQVCDGCGGGEGPMESLGFVIKRDYCEKCAVAVRAHLECLDGAHEDLAERWNSLKRTLEDEWSENHTGTLPDR